jgi:hypothetical protein
MGIGRCTGYFSTNLQRRGGHDFKKNPKIIGRSGIIKNETLAKEGIGGKGEG